MTLLDLGLNIAFVGGIIGVCKALSKVATAGIEEKIKRAKLARERSALQSRLDRLKLLFPLMPLVLGFIPGIAVAWGKPIPEMIAWSIGYGGAASLFYEVFKRVVIKGMLNK